MEEQWEILVDHHLNIFVLQVVVTEVQLNQRRLELDREERHQLVFEMVPCVWIVVLEVGVVDQHLISIFLRIQSYLALEQLTGLLAYVHRRQALHHLFHFALGIAEDQLHLYHFWFGFLTLLWLGYIFDFLC